jgi:purine nucleosidase
MAEVSARRIILDCDPGHDDAMAILLAHGHPGIDLAAITTVAGNHPLEVTTFNARRVASLAGIRDVPIAAGAASPLLRPLVTAEQIHGEAGLEGFDWPTPEIDVSPEHAVDLIVELVMSQPGEITLVPIGPLTNIALALRREPRIAERVREVVLMGGSWSRGNQTPAAEFNIFVDPEAAAIVFGAGWPVTMIGLEVTERALATREVLDRIQGLGSPVARAVAGLLDFYAGQHRRETGMNDPPVHDPCTVAQLVAPELVPLQPAHVEIELTGTHTLGMTVTWFRQLTQRPVNARVGVGLDAAGFWDVFVGALARI